MTAATNTADARTVAIRSQLDAMVETLRRARPSDASAAKAQHLIMAIREVQQEIDETLTDAVLMARSAGVTFDQIGDCLGVMRSDAKDRMHKNNVMIWLKRRLAVRAAKQG